MSSNRLRQIEENFSLLQEQLGALEKTLILAPAEERLRIKQRIRLEIRPEIRKYEEEYWHILKNRAESLPISESEAETIIAEIVNQVDEIEMHQSPNFPNEVLQLLQEIRNKLNQPKRSAEAKVKATISSFPPFISVFYEADLDTKLSLSSTKEFLGRYFPTFTGWIERAAKKK